ncbi:hypothetical protein [Calothrix sp. NIES-2098]|uniref:hypothetical protein n=1 Tax=Calothrix sp. NIES-2098 TaxID=1954171 RepID=UPI000B5E2695|nr:hypothetical protein NIES2098_71090 [Calothrix sp. NIES-2098]
MAKEEDYISDDSIFLYRGKLLNLEFYRKNYGNSLRDDRVIEDAKSPRERKNNTYKSEYKYLCLLIGVLALLSIGMCIQADAIAQALREIARTSVQQTIRMK